MRTRLPLQAAVVFGAALLVRLLNTWALRSTPYFDVLMGDARGYDEWALRLAGGDWIGNQVFYQAPLYPYFLGVLYSLFGRDLLMVRVVQAALGAAGCALLAGAATRLFSPRAGWICGLGLAFYAPAIFLDSLVQKSSLDVFFVCLVVYLVAALVDRPNQPLSWLGLGTALGGLSLTRENAMVLAAVAIGWAIAIGWRLEMPHRDRWIGRWSATAAVLLGLALVLLPVALRNKAVGGEFFLTTSQFGSNLFIGNSPYADGTYVALREGRGNQLYERQDAIELAEQAVGRPLSPGEVSTYWRNRAVRYVISEPVSWLRLVGRKMLLLVNDGEMVDSEAQESYAEWSPVLQGTGYVGRFGVLLPLAILGIVLTWTDRSRLWVLYVMAAAYAVSVLVFFVSARYRYPLVPFAAVFAAGAVDRLAAIAGRRPRRGELAAVLVALAVAAIAFWPLLSVDAMRSLTESNLAAALQAQGRLEEAAQHFRRAIGLRPEWAEGYNNLGITLREQGRLDEAISAYETALQHRRDYPAAHYNLGIALLDRLQPAKALEHFRIARESPPASASAHDNYGLALVTLGHADKAGVEFQEARRVDRPGHGSEAIAALRGRTEAEPGNPGAYAELGDALLATGRFADAEKAYRAALRLASDSARAHHKLGIALAAQRRLNEATAEFHAAVQIEPGFGEARQLLEIAMRSHP